MDVGWLCCSVKPKADKQRAKLVGKTTLLLNWFCQYFAPKEASSVVFSGKEMLVGVGAVCRHGVDII